MPAFRSRTNIKPSVVTNRSAVFASSAMLGADRSVSPGSAAPSGRFRRELILDVEHAHAGVVVGGEDGFLALHRAGAVFVQVVRAERAKRTVVAVPRCVRVPVPAVKNPTGFSLRGSVASRIVTPSLNMWPT